MKSAAADTGLAHEGVRKARIERMAAQPDADPSAPVLPRWGGQACVLTTHRESRQVNVIVTRLARASTILTEPTARYDNVSILLHWLTAALIILLWIIAQVIDDFAKGTPRGPVGSHCARCDSRDSQIGRASCRGRV